MPNLANARLSLEGLSVGDALGGFFEMSHPDRPSHHVTNRTLPEGKWRYTDDTNMALSVYAILRQYQRINEEVLAASFVAHYDRSRGYGSGMRTLFARVQNGQSWREASETFFGGSGSYGNGGAMRAAPIGAYFADDMTAVIENTQLATAITHRHPEGIAGAIAIAVATALAHQKHTGQMLTPHQFMERVVHHIPPSEVRQKCEQAIGFASDVSTREAAKLLGNGADMTAQRTVPFALWCAAVHLHDFREAIWQCLSAGGDTDTIAAMVGGVVAVSVGLDGIPPEWVAQREPLPDWALEG